MAVTLNYIWPPTGAVAPTAAVMASQSLMVVDVTASVDADTTATIPHLMTGFGPGFTAPLFAVGQPLLSQALTALSAWTVAAPGVANVVATKLATTGSSNAQPQLRVIIFKPASLIQ